MERAAPSIWALSDEICTLVGVEDHEGLIEMLKES